MFLRLRCLPRRQCCSALLTWQAPWANTRFAPTATIKAVGASLVFARHVRQCVIVVMHAMVHCRAWMHHRKNIRHTPWYNNRIVNEASQWFVIVFIFCSGIASCKLKYG